MADHHKNPASQTAAEAGGKLGSERSRQGHRSAAGAVDEAREELTQKASHFAAEAKTAAADKAEDAKRGIGAGLDDLAGALRAAGDHLAEKEDGAASRLIRDTAAGIEQLASSLQQKSLEDVIGEVRSFGRDNAGALMAGSALAGLALGRLVRATSLTRQEGGPPLKAGQVSSAGRSRKHPPAGEISETARAKGMHHE